MYSKTPSTTGSITPRGHSAALPAWYMPRPAMWLCAALALSGCSKGSNGAAPAAPAAPPAVSLTVPIASDADYIAKATAGVDRLTAIFKSAKTAAGTDCPKLAAELTQFTNENAAFLKATREYETAHPAAQKQLEASAKSNMSAFEAAAQPVATACQDNKAARDAMSRLAED